MLPTENHWRRRQSNASLRIPNSWQDGFDNFKAWKESGLYNGWLHAPVMSHNITAVQSHERHGKVYTIYVNSQLSAIVPMFDDDGS